MKFWALELLVLYMIKLLIGLAINNAGEVTVE